MSLHEKSTTPTEDPPDPAPHRTLSDLPLELLTIIQTYLDPVDIISLRKTCKNVASSTRDRKIWTNTLLRVCSIHGVFAPTFPMKEMTLKAIEFAALTPSRFISFVLKQTEHMPLVPYATRILRSRGHVIKSLDNTWRVGEGNFVDLRLIPGGRFLLTNSRNSVIHLWDFGYSAGSVIQPKPLASYVSVHPNAIGPGEIQIKGIHEGDDGAILVILDDELPTGREITVLAVFPLHNAPRFFRIGSSMKNLDVNLEIFATTRGMFAFHHGTLVTVWSYFSNSIATWDVTEEYTHLLIFDKNVILFDSFKFRMWKIPPLQPLPIPMNIFNATHEGEVPIFSFTYSCNAENEEFVVSNESWVPLDRRPFYFTALVNHDDGPVLDYYLMKSLDQPDDPLLPPAIPVLVAATATGEDHTNSDPYYGLHVGDKWLVQPWVGAYSEFKLNVTQVSDTGRRGATTQIRTLYLPTETDNKKRFTFCPASGRLCALIDDNEIRVMDFIIPN